LESISFPAIPLKNDNFFGAELSMSGEDFGLEFSGVFSGLGFQRGFSGVFQGCRIRPFEGFFRVRVLRSVLGLGFLRGFFRVRV
jgi:hypothetical protein